MKKKFLSVFICLILTISSVIPILADDATGDLDTVSNGESVGTVMEGVTIGTNYGSIGINKGTITENKGIVTTNEATITSNFGTVTNNSGTITDNYGTVTNNTGTVSNSWCRICTNIDIVEINFESDSESYVGETGRKVQIEGAETSTIFDDVDALYVRANKSIYLCAAQSATRKIVPDRTDPDTKSLIDSGKLVYDEDTLKTKLSIAGVESGEIHIAFEMLDKNSGPDGGINWKYDFSSNTLKITANTEADNPGVMKDYTAGTCPWNDYQSFCERIIVDASVSSIGENAFYGFNNLNKLIIPKSCYQEETNYGITPTCFYSVKFDSQGGSEVEAQEQFANESDGKFYADKPSDPTKDGYYFGGWYTDATCNNKWDFSSEITDDITLYAEWCEGITEISILSVPTQHIKENNKLIPVNNDGTAASKESVKLPDGANYTVECVAAGNMYGEIVFTFALLRPAKGYLFTEDDYELTIPGVQNCSATHYTEQRQVDSFNEMLGDNIAKIGDVSVCCFSEILYKVSYNTNGHGSTEACAYANGTTIEKPADPTATGYTFGGWYKEAACTNAWDFATDVVSGNTTLYAKWTANKYNVTLKYDANGGSGAPASQNAVVTYPSTKSTFTVSTTKPTAYTKSGYTVIFDGWYTEKTGGTKVGTTYTVGSLNVADNQSATLYAHWKETKIKYTISFHGNGQTSGQMSNMTCEMGTAYTLYANAYRKTGYTFDGWNTKLDGSGTKYVNNATVKNLLSTSGATITLYAQWKIETYKITYNLNGGTNNTKNPSAYNVTSTAITLRNPVRKGYTFGGWYLDKAFTKKVTSIPSGSTGNKVFYAKWSVITYKITYYLNGGKNNSKNPSGYKITTTTFSLKKPTRTGYTFGGWYSDKKLTKKVTSIVKGTTGNKTLYAKWTANKYTVKFHANGGIGSMMTKTMTYGKSTKLTKNTFTRKGYTFLGWSTVKTAKTAKYKNLAAVKNLTSKNDGIVILYAVWKKK